MNKIKEKGFTLVELIVVLAILATLAAIMVPSLTGYIDKAKETELISMAKSIHTAAQIEASEAYARGPFVVKDTKPATGNYVSVKNITANSELKNWGYPGEDWPFNRLYQNHIYNGFGYKNAPNGKYQNDAYYHFKVFVSMDGKILELAVCDGEKAAILKDGQFEVVKNLCKEFTYHADKRLYNYVIYQYDSSSINVYNGLIIGK